MSSRRSFVDRGRGSWDRMLGFTVGLVLLLGIASGVRAQTDDPGRPKASPESRLLEAEILELADGDLDAAMSVYRELAESAGVSADLSARALFALGRCHRKKGELGAARDRFHELIERFPDQPRLVDLARRFAAEIEAGRSELPEFDWMSQVGANPEIQARIFELGMQLVESEPLHVSGDGAGVKQKIRALGVITIPVLDPMLENSRVPEHRVHLAQVLVELGRVERLPIYIEGCSESVNSWLAFIDRVLDLPPDRRRAAADVLRPLEMEREASRELLAALRLALDVRDRFEDDLNDVGESWWHVSKIVLARDETARRVAAFLASSGDGDELSSEEGTRLATLAITILEHRPDLLGREQLAGLLRVTVDGDRGRHEFESRLQQLVDDLVARDRFDLALHLAGGDPTGTAARHLVDSLPRVDAWEDHDVPIDVATQANLLRRAGGAERLHRLALERDEAVSEFERFLLSGPEPWRIRLSPFGEKSWGEVIAADPRGRRTRRPPKIPEVGAPTVSEALADAMVRVLERSEHVPARVVAALVLARADAHGDRRYFLRLVRAVQAGFEDDSGQDSFVTFIAVSGVLRHCASDPSLADTAVPLVDRYLRAFTDGGEQDLAAPSAFLEGRPRSDLWMPRRPESHRGRGEWSGLMAGLIRHAYGPDGLQSARDGVMPVVVEGLLRQDGLALFHGFVQRLDRDDRARFHELLGPRLHEIDSTASARALVQVGIDLFVGVGSFPRRLYETLIGDPEIGVDPRKSLLTSFARSTVSHPWGGEAQAFLRQFDWSTVLRSRDELAQVICIDRLLRSYVLPHAASATLSPYELVRQFGVENIEEDDPEFGAVIERAFEDDSEEVVSRARYRVLNSGAPAVFPWLYLLSEERTVPGETRVRAIQRLAVLADRESLPRLAMLLDDDDFSVRNAALEAMTEIENKLIERERMKGRYGAGSSKPEPPK